MSKLKVERDRPYMLVRLTSEDVHRALLMLLAAEGIVPTLFGDTMLMDFRGFEGGHRAAVRWEERCPICGGASEHSTECLWGRIRDGSAKGVRG